MLAYYNFAFFVTFIRITACMYSLEQSKDHQFTTAGTEASAEIPDEDTMVPSNSSFEGSSGNISKRRNLSCNFAPGVVPGDRKRVLKCCKTIVKRYERYWAGRSMSLNRYLTTLKVWQCPQFHKECEQRLFGFNTFTDLMYDYHCNYMTFVDKCIGNVSETIGHFNERTARPNTVERLTNFEQYSIMTRWKKVISRMQPAQMTMEELLQPCVQVAQLDLASAMYGSYQEVIDFGIPSCSIAWCGFSSEAMEAHHISVWTCLSQGCRSRIIAIMVFCGVLGLAIAILNLLIILVLSTSSHSHNSQSTYKLSLAAADLLVGIVVLPLAIDILGRLVWTRHEVEGYNEVKGYEVVNDTLSESVSQVQVPDRAGEYHIKFPKAYRNFAGFFLAISIFVSVYTLAGAGFDRLRAVYAPLSYRKEKAHKVAKKICIISWIVACIFGLLPMFTPRLSYALILSVLFATLDYYGIILYSVGLLVPLVVVWVVNILTFTVSKKHSKFRRQLTRDAQKKGQVIERRLASTLRLMVSTFTFNTLPLVVLLICSYFLPTTHPSRPRDFKEADAVSFITIEFVASMLLFGNSVWNFFIYNIKNRDFRQVLTTGVTRILEKAGFSACVDTTISCCRTAVHNSRRRISSFQSFSRYTYRKKSSVTAVTKVSSVFNVEETTSGDFNRSGRLGDDSLMTGLGQTGPTDSTYLNNESSFVKLRDNTQVTIEPISTVSDLATDQSARDTNKSNI